MAAIMRSLASRHLAHSARPPAARLLLLPHRGLASGGVPLALVKELRAVSGAPIVDCKKALQAEGVNGDLKKAFEWLRKKGQASVAKSSRATNEGLVGVAVLGADAVMVEVNCETDFVARNEDFQSFVSRVAVSALKLNLPDKDKGDQSTTDGPAELDVATLLQAPSLQAGGSTVKEDLDNMVAKIRENLTIRRAAHLHVGGEGQGFVAAYVHNSVAPGVGSTAALVGMRTPSHDDKVLAHVEKVGKRVAMHIVAAKPRFLSPNSVPSTVVDKEREVVTAQAAASGKPPAIVAKMTEGRLRKFLSEISLMDQPHMVEEGNPKVKDFLTDTAKALGVKVEVTGFLRYRCGEVEEVGGSK